MTHNIAEKKFLGHNTNALRGRGTSGFNSGFSKNTLTTLKFSLSVWHQRQIKW
jgi:hypothetical protein